MERFHAGMNLPVALDAAAEAGMPQAANSDTDNRQGETDTFEVDLRCVCASQTAALIDFSVFFSTVASGSQCRSSGFSPENMNHVHTLTWVDGLGGRDESAGLFLTPHIFPGNQAPAHALSGLTESQIFVKLMTKV